jgi:hypothetical protein
LTYSSRRARIFAVHLSIGRGYQVIGKGYSANRAHALARQVVRWDPYGTDAYVGLVPSLVDYGRPVQVIVKKGCFRTVGK